MQYRVIRAEPLRCMQSTIIGAASSILSDKVTYASRSLSSQDLVGKGQKIKAPQYCRFAACNIIIWLVLPGIMKGFIYHSFSGILCYPFPHTIINSKLHYPLEMELIHPMDDFFPLKIASMNDCSYSQIIAYFWPFYHDDIHEMIRCNGAKFCGRV